MMELPSESHSSLSQILVPILSTIGAGGALKFYAQWQAGRTSVRAELQTRVRTLEENLVKATDAIADLREQRGGQQATIDGLRREVDGLRKQNGEQAVTISALQKQNGEQAVKLDVLEQQQRHSEKSS